MVYDEFESVAMRNTIGKSKANKSFQQLHQKLLERSFEHRYKVEVAKRCEKTGWPIDLVL